MADGPWTKYAQSSTPAAAEDGPWSKYAPTQDSSNAAQAPNGTLSAAQPPSWGTQLVNDLEEGGNRTFIGRALGHMQGNGDKGYTGLDSGVSKGAADYVGSPELGIAKMIQGGQDVPQHPLKGALRVGEGALQAASLPMTFAGGPTAEAGINAIPSRKAAGQMFESVMGDAANQPVTLTRALEPLERTQQLASRGAAPVRAADQLYQRINTTNPLTYREARDFASNLSGLSRTERMATNPTMTRSVGQLSHAFNADVGDAAAAAGRGEDYANAMKEYARAARWNQNLKTAAKVGIPAAGAAIGLGQGTKIVKGLLGQ